MELLLIIVGAFATWRITYMIQQEKGPLEVFSKLQAWFWTDPIRTGGLKDGLRCFNCTSVWIAFIIALLLQFNSLGLFLVAWFAIAAGATFVNSLNTRLN